MGSNLLFILGRFWLVSDSRRRSGFQDIEAPGVSTDLGKDGLSYGASSTCLPSMTSPQRNIGALLAYHADLLYISISPSKQFRSLWPRRGGNLPSKGFILAVDDTPASLRLLTEILTAEGYDVRPADTANWRSPRFRGQSRTDPAGYSDGRHRRVRSCRRLKQETDTRDIPLMFISAMNDTGDRVAGLELGAVDFISKPFQKEELLARIRTHLELPASEPVGRNGSGTNGKSENCKRPIAPGACRATPCRAGAARK